MKRYVELNVIHVSTLYREKEHQELTKKVDDFQRELRSVRRNYGEKLQRRNGVPFTKDKSTSPLCAVK